MKYNTIWYDHIEIRKEGPIVEANNEEEARKKAFEAYGGNPPAPQLHLEVLH